MNATPTRAFGFRRGIVLNATKIWYRKRANPVRNVEPHERRRDVYFITKKEGTRFGFINITSTYLYLFQFQILNWTVLHAVIAYIR